MRHDLVRLAHDALCLTEPPFLKHYRRGRFRVWNGVAMSSSELPGPGFNFAACVGPCPPLGELLPVARDFFAGCEQGWGVLVEGDAGHPVEAELRASGWQVAEDEPAYVLPELPPAGPTADAGVRPARTDANRLTIGRVASAAYGSPPEFADAMLPSLVYLLDPDMCWLLAERDGEAVAAGGYYRVNATAVVCCLATPEPHRGRGLGTAVLRALLADAAARGCTSAALRSGPLSVPLYERFGFRFACRHRTYAAPQ